MRYFLIILYFLSFEALAGQTRCYDMVKEIPCGSIQFPRQAGDYTQQNQSNHYQNISVDVVKDNNEGLV